MRQFIDGYILRPLENTTVYAGTSKFRYFEVIHDGEVIDVYDVINIEGNVRIDLHNYNGTWCARVFGREDEMSYDLSEHTIRGGN